MKKTATGARLILGFLFTMTGLNGFLNFLPQPKDMPAASMAFAGAMMQTHYFMPLLMGTQLACGALLLSNRFVPLALAMLASIIVNIVAFHVFLAPSGLPMAFVVLALESFLAWRYVDAFRPMLAAKAGPRG